MSEPDSEDIMLWPCGTWCYREDLQEYTHKSDDYEVTPYGSDRWISLNEERGE